MTMTMLTGNAATRRGLELKDACYIDGAWTSARSAATRAADNPATGETIGVVPDLGRTETRAAIEAAHAPFPAWRSKTGKERATARWAVLVALLCSAWACSGPSEPAEPASPSAQPKPSGETPITSIESLNERARQRIDTKARVALDAQTAGSFKEIHSLGYSNNGNVPNYVRALTLFPDVAKAFAGLAKAVIHDGPLAPEIKLAAALRVAQINNSAYTAAHVQRLLRASERGRSLLENLASGDLSSLREADRVALTYADALTNDVQAGSDTEFQAVQQNYGDDEIVDLTAAVGFFNYFTRFTEALALPVESWALDSAEAPSAGKNQANASRVALLSDEEIAVMSGAARAVMERPNATSGLALPNSQRAMLRVPALSLAWTKLNTALKGMKSLDRETTLQVSFAVSMENGCRYCTMHQVVGLRRLGVSPAKLMAMQKDDETLTPHERVAVNFARKLTRTPSEMTDADYESLRAEFGEQGALKVLLQTCRFAFMNRFTDGLRLPSEDEAIKVYREVYGTDEF